MTPYTSFGRGLALGTLGLLLLSLVVRTSEGETHRPRAHFAFIVPLASVPGGRPAAGPLAPAETPASTPAEVVLRVRPLPSLEPPAVEPPPPPPYPLLIPVTGVRPRDLADTFGDARDSTRLHRAIDILAPTGTPVVATVQGHVIRTYTSTLGGLTVYQVGPDSAWVFYYAHLDRYADGLRAGQAVAQGDTLGYVGETGNAPIPHLHFAVWKARPGSTRLWGGRAINPYPLLNKTEQHRP